MRTQRYIFIGTVIGIVLALTGCGDGDDASDASAQAPVATTDISVQDNSFGPAAVEVAAGDTVTWTWEGDNDHNVVGDDFQSDTQNDGTFEQSFDQAGTYTYQCTLHGGMGGTVVVTDSGGAASEEA
jgi:plastocyanin